MTPGGETRSSAAETGRHGTAAADVARGICRMFGDIGYSTLTEMQLSSRRRVDVIGLDRKGLVAIVEIKISVADLRADRKWRDYLPFCDRFYFGVPGDFPREPLPGDVGLIVADRHGGAVVRDAETLRLAPATRRALTLRFARLAADRLRRSEDPPV
jgi:hypothetical protein